jgi:hypothetical protein
MFWEGEIGKAFAERLGTAIKEYPPANLAVRCFQSIAYDKADRL